MSPTIIVIASLCAIPLLVWLGMWVSRPIAQVIHAPDDPAISAVAWVFGGPLRVCQTWWVELHNQGILVADGVGRVKVLPHQAVQSDRWLCQALANTPIDTSLTRSQVMKHWQPALEALRTDLIARRMLSPHYHSWMVALHRLIGVSGIVLAVWVGLSANTGLAWVAVLLATFSWLITIRVFGIPRLTTGAIDWRQDQARAASAAIRAPQDHSVALAVAVGGTMVLMGTPYAVHATGVQRSDGGGGGCGTAASAGGASEASGCGSPSDASGGFDTGGGFGGGDSATGGDGGSGCGGGGCGGCGS